MADIERNVPAIVIEGELKRQHIQIQINEKKSQVKAFERQLEDLKDIAQKKLEFNINCANKEIEMLEKQLEQIQRGGN